MGRSDTTGSGPAAAVTPGVRAVAANCGAVALEPSDRAVRWAPSCRANPSGPHPPAPPALPVPGVGIPPVDGAVHPWQILLALLVALPLVVRRRYPLAAFVVVVGAALLYDDAPGFGLAFLFAGCVIAAYNSYRTQATGCVMVGGGLVIADHKASLPAIGTGVSTSLSLLLVFLAANAPHSWRQRMRSLAARQEAAAPDRAEQALLAVETGAARR
ncbi:hypothetical protein ACFQU9_14145 [Actinomadura namibiensis]|uniref:Uncharacterized protein n=1 Tax=Actinomadura namibiensis TaxID=182080 RepID=A0A7W3LZ64_ACTNM|nr:hypothetical protein [Actinomadura namibiensis]MBA8956903.1 hypothetical protein [Actinomadura namibiensis]